MATKKPTNNQIGMVVGVLAVLGVSIGSLQNLSKQSEIETGFNVQDQAENIASIPGIRTELANSKEDIKENAEKGEADVQNLEDEVEEDTNRKDQENLNGTQRESDITREFEREEMQIIRDEQHRFDELQNQRHNDLQIIVEELLEKALKD